MDFSNARAGKKNGRGRYLFTGWEKSNTYSRSEVFTRHICAEGSLQDQYITIKHRRQRSDYTHTSHNSSLNAVNICRGWARHLQRLKAHKGDFENVTNKTTFEACEPSNLTMGKGVVPSGLYLEVTEHSPGYSWPHLRLWKGLVTTSLATTKQTCPALCDLEGNL